MANVKKRIRVSKKDRVFLLEDSLERINWFRKYCPEMVHVESASAAILVLLRDQFDFVFLDHDLGLLDYLGYEYDGKGTGREVARYLSKQGWKGENVIIHSWNMVGAKTMGRFLPAAKIIPFGDFEIDRYDMEDQTNETNKGQ